MRFLASLLVTFLIAMTSIVAGSKLPNSPSTSQGPKKYALSPDALPQEGVPKGKLEGPTLFKSKVFANTVRQYWVYVPSQYKADQPACQESQARRPRPRRVQHHHRRNDGQRRECDHERQRNEFGQHGSHDRSPLGCLSPG